jgi:tetratricopeptide (TPR) repeat protein
MGKTTSWIALLVLLAGATASFADTTLDGDPRRAVERIEAQSPAETRDADTWFRLAEAYHRWMDEAGLLKKRGLAGKMKRALESALAIDPAHLDARRELIDFHHYAPRIAGGSRPEAERQLVILETIDPGAAWAVRGAHARSAGDHEQARDAYLKALEFGEREPERLFALAVVQQQLGSYPDSIALLDETLAADPEHEKANYYRARASAMSGQELERGLECAVRYLEDCVECDDEDRGYGWWRRASILKRQGASAEAMEAYREALRLHPDLEGARKGLAELER